MNDHKFRSDCLFQLGNYVCHRHAPHSKDGRILLPTKGANKDPTVDDVFHLSHAVRS